MNRETENLFHELADLSCQAREAYYLRHHTAEGARAEVEALLQYDAQAEEALAECVAASAERFASNPAAAGKPARCGPYRLTRLLGRGGMGAVYLGERADGEVEQCAAIKLLRYSGDEPRFLERFLRERQILATLHHPGIARLLDAGRTAEGQPYLAMDFVEGEPIDLYARDLDVRQKLQLFLQVCAAAAYAHRNLIVHCDLKPSNILVDRAGEPKLLDFGIAKILDVSLASEAGITQTRERWLTPEYASPEQLRGEGRTAATDIYSLGAVLYQLLTGRSPHAFSGRTEREIEEAICRGATQPASKVNPELPKDLDYILGKALRKEPGERYASVDAFADDLRAFLDWRPIRARSGNAWYRTRKFARRYRVAVTATALALTGLSAGWIMASRERAIAELRFEQVRRIANKALALDSTVQKLQGGIKAREEIVAMSEDYLAGLHAESSRDPELALETAQAYIKLALIEGVPSGSNLGRRAQAQESLQKALALLQGILKKRPGDKHALSEDAEAEHDLMILADTAKLRNEALAHAAKAAKLEDEFLKVKPNSAADQRNAARVIANIALLHKNLHLYPQSIAYARRAAEVAKGATDEDVVIGQALSVLADAERLSGNLESALQAIEEARTRIERAKFSGESMRRTSLYNVLWRQGAILGEDGSINLNRPQEAAAALQQAYDLMDQTAREDAHDVRARILAASAARELGGALRKSDAKGALEAYDKGLQRIREVDATAETRRDEALLLAESSYALRGLKREEEARERIELAVQRLREAGAYDEDRVDPPSEAFTVQAALGDQLAGVGQFQRAAETYQRLLSAVRAFGADTGGDLGNAIRVSQVEAALAAVDRRVGKPDAARELDGARAALWQGWQQKLPQSAYVKAQVAAAQAN